jgi:hypothetical protein
LKANSFSAPNFFYPELSPISAFFLHLSDQDEMYSNLKLWLSVSTLIHASHAIVSQQLWNLKVPPKSAYLVGTVEGTELEFRTIPSPDGAWYNRQLVAIVTQEMERSDEVLPSFVS